MGRSPKTDAAYQANLKAQKQPLTMGGLRLAEQASRPKSITDYVATYGGQRQRDWAEAQLRETGVSKSNMPDAGWPKTAGENDPALSKAYLGTKSSNKNEPSNYISGAVNPDANAGLFYDAIDNTYYVQGRAGNVVIDGKKYFPTNSAETVYLYPTYNTINYDFQSEKFFELVNVAVPNGYKPLGGDYLYVAGESTGKGSMNQKINLDKDTLYLTVNCTIKMKQETSSGVPPCAS